MSDSPASIVARDRRLALARLELAIEAITAGPSDAARELASLWARAEAKLTAAIGQPRLEEWIAAAEHLVATGVHHRYPDVHLAPLVGALEGIAASDDPPELENDPIVARVLDAVSPDERALVETAFVTAACGAPDAPWVAGLLRHGIDLDRDTLVAAAYADVARRESRLRAFLDATAFRPSDVLDLGHGLCLRKTRRADRDQVEDWSAIDALTRMSTTDLQRLSAEPIGEAGAYLTAIHAYQLGEFDVCVEALRRCLAEDADVEEYWSLLAFAERHLRHQRSFERIVFARDRDVAGMR